MKGFGYEFADDVGQRDVRIAENVTRDQSQGVHAAAHHPALSFHLLRRRRCSAQAETIHAAMERILAGVNVDATHGAGTRPPVPILVWFVLAW